MSVLRPVTLGAAIALIYLTLASGLTHAQSQLNELIPSEEFRAPPPPPGPAPSRTGKGGATYVRFVAPAPPPGRPPGGRYKGGGTRSLDSQTVCPAVTTPLTALVPFTESYLPGQDDKPPITNVWGYTTVEHPTLWFYVPYTSRSLSATFSLQDDDAPTQPPYEAKVRLPSQPGLISVRVPQAELSLQPGKRYRWFFGIDCTPPNAAPTSTETIYVEGTILRGSLKPEASNQLAAASPEQKAAIYAENGFWYDALAILAELRQQHPEDPALLQLWKSLLAGMGTSKGFKPEEIAPQPFVN